MSDEEHRRETAEVVNRFFAALEAIDIDRFVALWHPNGIQEMPFSPDGFPNRLEGREAIRRQYGGMPRSYRSMSFEVETEPMLDPHKLVARYRGSIELAAGGRYDNLYFGIFEVRDGVVTRFTEFFDPIVLQRAFGEHGLTETFSIEDG